MISVPISSSSRGSSALTLPCVPTGMNTGVSMAPRAVVSRPSRALVEVSFLSNSNMGRRLSHEGRVKKRQRCACFSCWPPSGPGVRNDLAAMPDAPESKRLQKTIIAYSALGMFVVGVAVGLVGVLPQALSQRENAHQADRDANHE